MKVGVLRRCSWLVVAVTAVTAGTCRTAAATPFLERIPTTGQSPNACMPDTGATGWCGDGGPAADAKLSGPRDVVRLPTGGYLIADTGNNVIRRVDPGGRMFTIVGDGRSAYRGDGGPALQAALDAPTGVAVMRDGSLLIADTGNEVLRRVTPDGVIERFAGTGDAGFAGDGGPALDASFDGPRDVAVAQDGSVIVVDTGNNRVRGIAPDGRISTVAGDGVAGSAGDGGPAATAELDQPTQVTIAPDGSLIVADRGNELVRRVDPAGIISTVAGGGAGALGPTGPARDVNLEFPTGVGVTSGGEVLITQAGRVSALSPTGELTNVAGTGVPGFSGSAAQALDLPTAVAPRPDGSVLVADSANDRVRLFSHAEARTAAGHGSGTSLCGEPQDPRWNCLRITSRRSQTAGDEFRLRFRTSRAGTFSGKAVPRARPHLARAAAPYTRTTLRCRGHRDPRGASLLCSTGGLMLEGWYRVTLQGRQGGERKDAPPIWIRAR